MFCPKCGAALADQSPFCGQCGTAPPRLPIEEAKKVLTDKPGRKQQAETSLLIAGYTCALVALLFLPSAFALAGFVIGIIVLIRGRVGHGVALIVLATTCGYVGMYFGTVVWNSLVTPNTAPYQSQRSSVSRPFATDWHVVSIESRVTESNNVWSKYAWKLTIRNDSAEPAVFSGEIEFQDSDGFIVDSDTAVNMRVEGSSEGVFTGYDLIKAESTGKVVRTVAKISPER